MAINFESAQLVVGAAIVDRRFARLLLRDRGRALREVEEFPGAPSDVRLSDEDRLLLGSIRAASLQEFARGVERLCGDVQPLPRQRPAAAHAKDLGRKLAAVADLPAPPPPGRRAARARPAHLVLLAPPVPLEAG